MKQKTTYMVNGSEDKIEEVFSHSALKGNPDETIESEDFIDDEEDSSLTYVAIGAAVAALGYTAYSYWPAITAAVSSAITWTTSVAIPAISAFALTSTGMITGMAVLGILLFGAIAYMKMSNSKTTEEELPPVRNPAEQLGNWAKTLKCKQNGLKKNPVIRIQSVGRMYLAKKELAELKKDASATTTAAGNSI